MVKMFNFIEPKSGIIVIDILVNLDSAEILTNFRERVAEYCKNGYQWFIIDFSGTNILSSAGFRELITLFNRVDEMGGKMAVCNMSPVILTSYSTLGFKKLFNHFDTREKAMESFS